MFPENFIIIYLFINLIINRPKGSHVIKPTSVGGIIGRQCWSKVV